MAIRTWLLRPVIDHIDRRFSSLHLRVRTTDLRTMKTTELHTRLVAALDRANSAAAELAALREAQASGDVDVPPEIEEVLLRLEALFPAPDGLTEEAAAGQPEQSLDTIEHAAG